jgi:hypothetical protein
MPQIKETDPKRRLARAMAEERLRLPAKDFLFIYNENREKLAPNLPVVGAIPYLPQDVMDLFVEELDSIAHPAPVEKPLTDEQQRLIAIGQGLHDLLANVAGQQTKTLEAKHEGLTKAVAEAMANDRTYLENVVRNTVAEQMAAERKRLEDMVLELMTQPPAPDGLPRVAQSQPSPPPPTPEEEPKFKVIVVDGNFPRIRLAVESQMPKNIKLDVQNSDHKPDGTLKMGHFVLMSRRTPGLWVNAYRSQMHQSRIIDLGTSGIDTYNAKLQEISKMQWFSL